LVSDEVRIVMDDSFVPRNEYERRARQRALTFYYAFHPEERPEDFQPYKENRMLEPEWAGKAEDTNGVVDENDLDDYRYNQSKDE
jgi:hypothetical protein